MKKNSSAIGLSLIYLFMAGCQEDKIQPTTQKWSFLESIKSRLPTDFSLSRLRQQVQAGDLVLASQGVNKAILSHPRCAPLHMLNGFIYEEMAKCGDLENVELARTAYRTAMELDPSQWTYMYILGVFELKQKNYLLAQCAFAEAVILRPNQWDLLYHLAHASYYIKDFPVALKSIEAALRLCPQNPVVQRTAAIIFSASGYEQKAQAAYCAYVRLTKGACQDQAWLANRLSDWKRTHTMMRQNGPQDQAPDKEEEDDDQPTVVMDCYLINVINISRAEQGVHMLKDLVLTLSRDMNWKQVQTLTENIPTTPSSNIWTKTRKTNLYLTNTGFSPTVPSGANINYGLNIAKAGGENFELLARPTVSTIMGKTVEFLGAEVVSAQVGSRFNVEAGIKILLRPIKIAADGCMTIQVDFTQSGFALPIKPESPITEQLLAIRKAQTQTLVKAYPGQTVLVAGINTTTRSRAKEGTPGLMDIPIIRYLTSNTKTTQENRVLLFCLTPRLGGKEPQKDIEACLRQGSLTAQKLAGFGLNSLTEYRNLYYILKHLSTSPLFCQFQHKDITPGWWGYGFEPLEKKLSRFNAFLYY